MSNPRVPQVLDDLYRDLRDRRLLPAVVLLLVALVAVPVTLSASSEAPPTASGADAGAQVDAPEAQPAVLAETPRLRDYRKRLDGLERRNPFKQKFQDVGLSRTEVEAVSQAAETAISGGEPSASSEASGDAPTTTPTTDETTTDSGGSGSGSDRRSKTKTVTKLETYRVDLRFGAADEVEKLKDVKPLDSLDPVALFVGVSEDGKKALFFVSAEVGSVSGDGTCLAFGGTGCGLLVLKRGDVAHLDYSPDAESYTLKLSDVERTLID